MAVNQVINLRDTSFLIPVRIDSLERFENLVSVTNYILSNFDTNIIVLEADKEDNDLLRRCLDPRVEIIFIKDHNPIFHRTKYINNLVFYTKTKYVAVWDADVIVNPSQMYSAVHCLRSGNFEFIYPYDGSYMETGISFRRQFIDTHNIISLEKSADSMMPPYTKKACGGGFLAEKAAYFKVGLENENFYGWGPEDAERLRRWQTLDMKVGRVKGYMFHLYHPRGFNSNFSSEETKLKLIGELNRIGVMSKEELQEEVKVWISRLISLQISS